MQVYSQWGIETEDHGEGHILWDDQWFVCVKHHGPWPCEEEQKKGQGSEAKDEKVWMWPKQTLSTS